MSCDILKQNNKRATIAIARITRGTICKVLLCSFLNKKKQTKYTLKLHRIIVRFTMNNFPSFAQQDMLFWVPRVHYSILAGLVLMLIIHHNRVKRYLPHTLWWLPLWLLQPRSCVPDVCMCYNVEHSTFLWWQRRRQRLTRVSVMVIWCCICADVRCSAHQKNMMIVSDMSVARVFIVLRTRSWWSSIYAR